MTTSLKRFEKQLIIAMKEKGWDGKEDEDTVMWTFAGALFYSITVITTIGQYSDISFGLSSVIHCRLWSYST